RRFRFNFSFVDKGAVAAAEVCYIDLIFCQFNAGVMTGHLIAVQNDQVIIAAPDSRSGLAEIVFTCFFCLVNLEVI
ncbi:MAG: hypothetical protein P8105_08295, partial [Dehalococcoidia bacterium]